MTPEEEWRNAAKILDACLKGSHINDDWGGLTLHEDAWKPIAAALRERDAAWAAAVNLEYEVRANVFRMPEEECQRKLAPLRALLEEAGK